MRSWRRRAVGAVAALGGLALAVTVLVPPATATNVEDAEAEAERVGREVAVIAEEFNEAEAQLTSLGESLTLAEARQADQQRYIDSLAVDMAAVAVEAFKGGGLDPSLQMLTADPLAYLENVALLDSISASQAATMAEYEAALQLLDVDRQTVAAQRGEVESLTQTLAARKADIERRLADAQAVLAEAQRLEAERAAATLAAGRTRAQSDGGPSAAGQAAAAVSASGSSPVSTSCAGVTAQAPNSRAAAAVEFACAQVGKPYQWGAEGPGSYDCSGLTSAAWAAAGVSLPRSSRQQFGAGARVGRSEIQPGDLVFYASGSTISHVGLAIGNGMMVDAYRTGQPVSVRSIDTLAQYLNYVGTTRP